MGLSLIAAAPDMDQQLKYMNALGDFATITPGQWVGESSLHSLGLADGDPNQGFQQFQQGVDVLANTAIRLKEAGVFGNKNKNKSHAPQGRPPQHSGGPAPMSMTSGSGGGLPSWVLWGGGILVVGLLLYVLMKKKKNGRDRDHDRDDEPHFDKGA